VDDEDAETVRERSLSVLTSSWREADGFCPPNPTVYPHQWLWDSCFHAIAWAAHGDPRGARELDSCLHGQLANGFVPHMRYFGRTVSRGPLPDRSSFTQPPIYAHAARVLTRAGIDLPTGLPMSIGRALDWLWMHRRTDDGLVYIVHPWESGSDDSPRWDSWVGLDSYDKRRFGRYDRRLVAAADFDDLGAAVWSRSFVVAPAAFNAFVAHAFAEFAGLTGDASWDDRARQLSAAIDTLLWDETEGLWSDLPIVGDGASARRPTLDGALGALVTTDETRARRALDQLLDPSRFGAPFGLAFVPPTDARYDADAYWRGPAWPQLNYMMWLAARRWERDDVTAAIATCSRRAALRSGFAEYWNPETGSGLGAIPQGWAALAAAFT
jgi:hypothetical protein